MKVKKHIGGVAVCIQRARSQEQKDSNNKTSVYKHVGVCVRVCVVVSHERKSGGGGVAPCHSKGDVNALTSVHMATGLTYTDHDGKCSDTGNPTRGRNKMDLIT